MYGDDDEDFDDDEAIEFGTDFGGDEEVIGFASDFGGDEEVIGFASDFGDDDEEESDPREAMEAALDEEEEEMAAEPEEEAEVSVDAEETEVSTPPLRSPVTPRPCVCAQIAQEDLPSGCPKGFALNFLWLDKYIAIAVDQIFGNASAPNATLRGRTMLCV